LLPKNTRFGVKARSMVPKGGIVPADAERTAALYKYGSLLVFMVQNSCNPIVFRWATTEAASGERYSMSVVLFLTEFTKLVFSVCLIAIEEGFSFRRAFTVLFEEVLRKPYSTLALAVPVVLYALQNALLQWSAGNLPAALWQVTYQGKILVTAVVSVILLRKQFKRVQWMAILIMSVGIAIVQLAGATESKQADMQNAKEQSIISGMAMLIVACFCSGLASVYFEKIVKQGGVDPNATKKTSVWVQNVQLASFSILINCSGVAVQLAETNGLLGNPVAGSVFQGITFKVWLLIINNAVGGLLVALVIKYADNILRGFSSSLATILSCFYAMAVFGFELKLSFGLGTMLVLAATLLYGGVFKVPGVWWNSECVCSCIMAGVPDVSPRSKEMAVVVGSKTENGLENAYKPVELHDPSDGSKNDPDAAARTL